ncbi:hypothetical protein [Methanocella sp. MCL-LM]|uniref:hypothetical protein n=1 Tax=Methanocella sp. MCL-LM TaxID=3412035 RepID=UPI003C70EBFE
MAVTILYVLMCELGHFLLAFFTGMIAWLLMTAVYNWLYSTVHLTQTDTSPGPVTRAIMSHSGTLIFLMAVSVGVLSHVLEDYYFSIV